MFEFDGGLGDCHRILLEDERWFGWENLYMGLRHSALRMTAMNDALIAARTGAATTGHYEIREVPCDPQL